MGILRSHTGVTGCIGLKLMFTLSLIYTVHTHGTSPHVCFMIGLFAPINAIPLHSILQLGMYIHVETEHKNYPTNLPTSINVTQLLKQGFIQWNPPAPS